MNMWVLIISGEVVVDAFHSGGEEEGGVFPRDREEVVGAREEEGAGTQLSPLGPSAFPTPALLFRLLICVR